MTLYETDSARIGKQKRAMILLILAVGPTYQKDIAFRAQSSAQSTANHLRQLVKEGKVKIAVPKRGPLAATYALVEPTNKEKTDD